jgi:hypothetical protein
MVTVSSETLDATHVSSISRVGVRRREITNPLKYRENLSIRTKGSSSWRYCAGGTSLLGSRFRNWRGAVDNEALHAKAFGGDDSHVLLELGRRGANELALGCCKG